MKGKSKGRGRGVVVLLLALPLVTVLLAVLGAKLILWEYIKEEQISVIVCSVTALVALGASFVTAKKMPRCKLLWGMGSALAYWMMLLLGNLLFFGEAYRGLLPVALSIFLSGFLGSLLGKKKYRKFA